jgi:hypothetical protein
MIFPLYYIDYRWCFLDVSINSNGEYLITFELIYNEDFQEISKESDITLEYITRKNILCMKDNMYYYYNTNNKNIHTFDDRFCIFSVDGSDSLYSLCNLKHEYSEYLYYFDDDLYYLAKLDRPK